MASKILIGSLVVLVMAVLGTVGVVYYHAEHTALTDFGSTCTPCQSSCSMPPLSECPAEAEAAPCCKEPARGESN